MAVLLKELQKPVGTQLKWRIILLLITLIVFQALLFMIISIKNFEKQDDTKQQELHSLQKKWIEELVKDYTKKLDEKISASWSLVEDQFTQNFKQLVQDLHDLNAEHITFERIDAYGFHEKNPFRRITTVLDSPELSSTDVQAVLQNVASSKEPKKQGERYIVETVAPLHGQEGVIGAIYAKMSLQSPEITLRSDSLLADVHLKFMLGSLIILAISAISLFIYLNRTITHPIQQLVQHMEHATQGHLEIRPSMEVSGEIGWLTLHFNRMIRQISQFQKELHQRIDFATKELAQKNEALQKANEELFALQRKLGQTERLASLGQLASTLAHELGTTLNVITGHLQLMSSQGGLDAENRRRLAILENQFHRLTQVIRDVLKTRRLPEPSFELIDLHGVLKDLVSFTQPTFSRKHIKVELDLEKSASMVLADRYQLEQVFMNLLSNAMDAMPRGGTLKVQTRKSTTDPSATTETSFNSEYVTVKFSDTGDGISPENLKKIFEPFFTTKEYEHGSGLGLTIAREIIQKHGGTIEVQSILNKGSTFEIRLPLKTNGR